MEVDQVENNEMDSSYRGLKQESHTKLMKVVKQTTKKLVQDETFMVMPSLSNCFDEFAQLTLPKPSDARNIVQLQEELEELRVAMEQSHLQD